MVSTAVSAPPLANEKIVPVYPSQLIERKSNNRFVWGDMGGLKKSILANGIKQPLRVRKTKLKTPDDFPVYEVLVGNRRARVAKEIGKDMEEETAFVPVIIEAASLSESDIIIASISTDAHGLTRTQVEIAYDVNVLVNEGWKGKDIAVAIGKSTQYVSDCIKFMTEANEELIKQVKGGFTTFTGALDLIKQGATAEVISDSVNKLVAKKKKEAAKSGEEVVNPDKKANVVNKVKKSEIQEQSGLPKKVSTSARDTSVKAAGSDTPKAPKVDETLLKLKQLHTGIIENKGTKRRGFANLLGFIIEFADGKKTTLDLMPFFFWGFDDEFDADYKLKALNTGTGKVVKPEPIALPTDKPAGVVDTDDLDELDEVPAPAAKPAKKSAPAPVAKKTAKAAPAKKGKKVADDDDAEAELEAEPTDADWDDELE
jgi:ParB/RepB/Spo0J family partition protein